MAIMKTLLKLFQTVPMLVLKLPLAMPIAIMRLFMAIPLLILRLSTAIPRLAMKLLLRVMSAPFKLGKGFVKALSPKQETLRHPRLPRTKKMLKALVLLLMFLFGVKADQISQVGGPQLSPYVRPTCHGSCHSFADACMLNCHNSHVDGVDQCLDKCQNHEITCFEMCGKQP